MFLLPKPRNKTGGGGSDGGDGISGKAAGFAGGGATALDVGARCGAGRKAAQQRRRWSSGGSDLRRDAAQARWRGAAMEWDEVRRGGGCHARVFWVINFQKRLSFSSAPGLLLADEAPT